ncbi:hypothetical protein BI364_13180 [Acidihalobacter yilgarnensis]|uniref:Uncharacterized protein n=1 Tax=Acidihalobacter yilgarnensis TaxID=2819280 RepID=A0A1D8IQK6_9GAMM|nr:hypothetical protein [Acidihalobacter yilgarnensis]AOU98790.1 hypothetical protein BI364_13180 [Acidihalobacter yilgarnensis]
MKRAFKLAVIAATGVALAAPLAAQADGRWDQGRHDDGSIARVLRVQPIIRVVRVLGPPVQRCTTEHVAYSRERRGDAVGATLVGGVVGG